MHGPLWSPAHHEGPPRSDVMRLLQHIASMLLLIGLLCHAAQAADQPDPLADEIARRAAAKWMDVLARIDSEGETLAACRASPDSWLKSLVALILRFTARLISPRPSSTICSNRRAAWGRPLPRTRP